MASSVYDASAFYAGVPFASPEEGCTTTSVFEEIEHIKKNHGAIDTLLQTRRLIIIDADKDSIDAAITAAKNTGDFPHMSKADISAVALALQIGGSIITDDFAVSNLAKNMGIEVQPVMTKGIRDVGRWNYYCGACKKEFSSATICNVCGSKLRKRLVKTKSF